MFDSEMREGDLMTGTGRITPVGASFAVCNHCQGKIDQSLVCQPVLYRLD